MQFPKIAFVLCAIAAVSTAVRAADNPDQAAARALLVSKLFEISGESASTNSASQPAKPAVTTPAPAYTAPSAPSFSTTTKVVPAVKAENNAAMHPVNQAVAPAYTPHPSRPPMSSEEHYRALRSPHQEIEDSEMNWTKAGTTPGANETSAAKPVTRAATKSAPVANPQATPSAVKANPEFVPVVAPALPIGAGQQQKLLDLLAKYKADQISPEEYHRQRAAIINGM